MQKAILLFGATGVAASLGELAKAHRATGKMSASMREEIGTVGSQHREDMPADAFLLGAERKYPVKVKEDGGWKYSPDLLLAAARRARMEGRDDLAAEADKIRARLEGGDNSTPPEKSMTKSILLFGAPGASDAIEALIKAHVQGYTRSDGTYVQPHEDERQAADPTTESGNKAHGFYEAAYHSHRREKYGADNDVPDGKLDEARGEADKAFSRTAHDLVQAGHFDKHEHARDYLDSVHGRHLGDQIGHKGSIKDVKWLPKSVNQFKASRGTPMKKPDSHDSLADFHTAASTAAARSGDSKGERLHDAAASAHDRALHAHKTGASNAAELSAAAHKASRVANDVFEHKPSGAPLKKAARLFGDGIADLAK